MAPRPQRLLSLDALRGFDMFWILGAEELAGVLQQSYRGPVTSFIGTQLQHVHWAGLHFEDIIFPLFVFIVGVASVFSLRRVVAERGKAAAARRILWRAGLLFVLGIFYNGGLQAPWPDVRLLGVLQRIAIAYAGAGLLYVYARPRTLAVVAAAILVGYWAALTFVPIRNLQLTPAALAQTLGPDTGVNPDDYAASPAYAARVRQAFAATTERVTGKYDIGLNVTNHFDFAYVPGRMYDVYWDPEGVLSMAPAIVNAILGVFAGLILLSDIDARRKVVQLLIGGAALLVIGYLWSLQFPIIKKIWSSSFVLVTSGYSAVLLAAFYYVVDIRGWNRWCTPFVWIGMNPITLYLASSVVSFHGIARRLVGGSVAQALNRLDPGLGEVVVALTGIAIVFLFARVLYRRSVFFKVR
jgi:predicted acyltransferase